MSGVPTPAIIGGESFRILRTAEEIARDVERIGSQLLGIASGRPPVFIGILKGSFVFLADLVRAFDAEHEIEFLSLTRYDLGIKDPSSVRVLHDLSTNIGGRLVVVIEGIRSSNGTKIEYIDRFLRLHEPERIVYGALVRQKGSVKGPIPLDTWGFEINDDEYVVGFGLDLDERYRNLPFIGIRTEEDSTGRAG
jgi:hypoxanthine phosphoribosyltransferase